MKTWFITGTSRGFGRAWTQATLERGNRVAATARNPDSLKDLVERFGDQILPLQLDVTRSISGLRSSLVATAQTQLITTVQAQPENQSRRERGNQVINKLSGAQDSQSLMPCAKTSRF
ncbi:hypothetical protein AVDCRST_MAG94-5624 [uncultured Leptolyngbya sp.]|uniref:Short-chain dehydrogenase/reductase SDR n=1 Tax=uncultured Leptolyngbya sp. TaxID=332963 RepID=A0A6J4NU57_9CYAN|nr:hypothetical protein AVDCRST_MAG94-5624 [uncultured Leptolyngbya sp.]